MVKSTYCSSRGLEFNSCFLNSLVCPLPTWGPGAVMGAFRACSLTRSAGQGWTPGDLWEMVGSQRPGEG